MHEFARTQFSRRRVLISLIGSAPFAALSAGGAAAGPKVVSDVSAFETA